MKLGLAVYAGTFDPPTNGHLWMVRQAAKIFKHLIIAVAVNPDKKCWFSLEERVAMWQKIVRRLSNVTVEAFAADQYLVNYARRRGAQCIIRGIRSAVDFEYEQDVCHFNRDIQPTIQTVFLVPPPDLARVRSSVVRSLVGPKGWEQKVKLYVPAAALVYLKQYCQKQHAGH